ncbi:type III-B CRISPR-associated protein Cas10/Cmr2 [Myxococcota bacterium]|nr:type III-B CRISPR-associated protein Cas10/Cmr2 [Myxococcota bacterium]
MDDHILLVSLGPIQEFIASARRCQDLWYGSWLLSALSRASASAMENIAGVDALIFPASLQKMERPSVANKILLKLPLDQVQRVAEAGRAGMQSALSAYREDAFRHVDGAFFHRELAEQQLDELMEFVWVAVPVEPDGYHAARARAEATLAARKNTRGWGAVPWHDLAGAGVPKSSLDGLRESVIDEKAYDTEMLSPEQLRKGYFVQSKERLCGVGLMKRVGVDPDVLLRDPRPTFHSTAHIAAHPLLTRVHRLGHEETVRAYFEALEDAGLSLKKLHVGVGDQKQVVVHDPLGVAKETHVRTFEQRANERGGVDGAVFFEGRLESLFEQYAPEGGDVQAARAALMYCLGQIGAQPNPYYAMLLADGDRMGKAIDTLGEIEAHKALGQALDKFAAGCRSIVEAAGGSLIYAGGDDVLALLPLHTALRCANDLRSSFAEWMDQGIQGQGIDHPTLSVGLALVHHLEPMAHVRKLAKEAEKLAKDEAGRNALAIVMKKRSGGATRALGRWDEAGIPLYLRLNRWSHLLNDEAIPDGVIYEIEALARVFEPELGEPPAPQQVKAALRSLTARVFGRKRANHGADEMDRSIQAELLERLEAPGSPMENVRRLSAELQIARLLLDARNVAWGGA